ncbi:MAG: polysaccharide biosynthesis protein [Planctomycetes bacterium]|nr:polysaccharide biosynthesis protein [Planctomycetota bacterium]
MHSFPGVQVDLASEGLGAVAQAEPPPRPRLTPSTRYLQRGLLKRGLDLAGASLALLVLSPVLLAVAALLRWGPGRHGGPVLERHERVGRRFRSIRVLGFRCEGSRLGPFLRRWKLDGLPRLLNVLRGDLSLVGPRPERRSQVEARRDDFEDLLRVRPGLVDLAAVRRHEAPPQGAGEVFPGEHYQHVLLPEGIRLGRQYLRSASFLFDLQVLCSSFGAHLRWGLGPPLVRCAEGLLKRMLPYRRWIVAGIHAALIALANGAAFLIRFEGEVPRETARLYLAALPALLVFRILGFLPFGLFSGLWRYVSIRDLFGIVMSVGLSSCAFLAVLWYVLGVRSYPGSVMVLDALLLIGALSGIRMAKRVSRALGGRRAAETRLLIIGAGDAGEMLLREIEMHPGYTYRPIGLIDDDPGKVGTRIRGVRVLGTRRDLPRIIREKRPDELLIAISAAAPEVLTQIVRSCRKFGLPVKCIPGLRDLLCTRRMLDTIRDVEPEDLLARPPVSLTSPELQTFYRGRSIMVTGAGGSIGSELVRQIARLEPGTLVLFERHEHSLYLIELELRRSFPHCRFVPVIGDILDGPRLTGVLERHAPSIVFHAAAYKHVPMMESNPQEAVKVNILGTKKVAQLAMAHGVERFVFISSDKAVNPTNVMGATKRAGELILQDLAKEGSTRFMAVRFGNVLESSGSVVPLFKEQIKRGGPVTITHPEISRFFMTTAEAVHLVLHAAILGEGGEIFVLDMGKPVRVLDMALQLISLYGYEPGRDIEVQFTGLRPGEKLHEELFNAGEQVGATRHPKILRVVPKNGMEARPLRERLPDIEEMARDAEGCGLLKERLVSVIDVG